MKAVEFIMAAFAGLVAGLIPLYAFCYLIYFLIGLPLRRQERARFFLDLIATGLAGGNSIEQTVVSIARSRDRSVGLPFHLLAAYLESGWGLIPALEKVSGLLPRRAVAMLKVGEELGNPGRIVPICRALLKDANSQVQSAYNYLVVLAFVLIPVIPIVFWLMTVFIMPKFRALFTDLLEGQPMSMAPFTVVGVLAQLQLALALLFYIGAVFYVGGPRFVEWLQAGLAMPNLDWIAWLVPWRRKRMQRAFAAMLSTLLDAGVPEARAVQLAAASTGNRSFIRRGARVVEQLQQGAKLTEAIGLVDEDGEFRWRLVNALRSGGGFGAALTGWMEALEARAFQQQQAFAQVLTTALVIYNGVIVSLFAIFVFRGITQIINEGVLW
jgi:type II secretory pathway component PulF